MKATVRRVSRCAQMARVHKIDTRSDTESDAETSPLLGQSGASAAASPQPRTLSTFFTPPKPKSMSWSKKLPSGRTIRSDSDTSEVSFRALLGSAARSKIMRRRVCKKTQGTCGSAGKARKGAYEKVQELNRPGPVRFLQAEPQLHSCIR